MKKCSLLLVVLFLLCGGLNLLVYADDAPAATETVLFSADFDSVATPEEAGISTTDWGEATLPEGFSMTVVDGKLNIKRDGDKSSKALTFAFEFLSKEELAQVGKLKVEYDVSSAMGGFNSGGNDYSVGLQTCRSATAADSWYSFQMTGKTFELVFSSARTSAGWERVKADYRYEITVLGTTAGLNQVHHVELIFDFNNRTVDYSIDDKAAKDPAPLPADDSGLAIEIYGKGYDLTIDNLKATQLSVREEAPPEGGDSGEVTNSTDTDAPTPPTTNPPKTDAPTTTKAPTDESTTPGTTAGIGDTEEKGCSSVIGQGTLAIVMLCGCFAWAGRKKKR